MIHDHPQVGVHYRGQEVRKLIQPGPVGQFTKSKNHHQITEILLKLDKHYKSTWNETQIMFLFKYSELENSIHKNLIVSHWPVFCENVNHDLCKPNIFWWDITT